jgi:hypothetical protein
LEETNTTQNAQEKEMNTKCIENEGEVIKA